MTVSPTARFEKDQKLAFGSRETTRPERGQIRNHSGAARPCSIWRRVGVQRVEVAISTPWIRILVVLFPESAARAGTAIVSHAFPCVLTLPPSAY